MTTRILIFVTILVVGMPVIWLFIRHAKKNGRVSFFGFASTSRNIDPKKYDRVLRSYRLQLYALPVVAFLVASLMEVLE
ncbi:hypothetical protein [Qipengyuania spongiae]|uniref:Uncharacterized protein n=1 Tax=Qipengyuania spongiae TaxID=2909673 RepID=A0ABY5SY41_9SPHN|nr:hypothetical protein [Qipengyuania spongiae]UVI39149.1 hypothetical protein L1F33_13090 [Qipengyuania spongiae]